MAGQRDPLGRVLLVLGLLLAALLAAWDLSSGDSVLRSLLPAGDEPRHPAQQVIEDLRGR